LTGVGACQNLSNLKIESSFGSYWIRFQDIDPKEYPDSYFLVDQMIKDLVYLPPERTIYVEAIESKKNLISVEEVVTELSLKGMTKNNQLLVIGGGFLQDIGTLVASLYMRGVDWTYAPTTLAAMGDSCIGGKSSINTSAVKNLIGNFYPPREVIINVSFTSSLPEIEVLAGLSEIIKICYARSFSNFEQCTRLLKAWELTKCEEHLLSVVKLSLESKKYFVEKDEFDRGIRKHLNFGHSFGHAIESTTNYKIPHGVAVMLGMMAATKHPMSQENGNTKSLENWIKWSCKFMGSEIKKDLQDLDYAVFAEALSKDKKNTSQNLVLILPDVDGLKIVEIPFKDKALEIATTAMKSGIGVVLNEIC
jgi:3-dehydroquinate synthase